MLFGERPRLQRGLLRRGHRMRIAVPYGPDWHAYFMRRLAERPANVLFRAAFRPHESKCFTRDRRQREYSSGLLVTFASLDSRRLRTEASRRVILSTTQS